MSTPSGIPEITFSVEGDFVPLPRAKPDRHGEVRIPSDHPVHDQKKRIRQAARAAGAMPVPDAAVDVECAVYSSPRCGRLVGVSRTITEALEGVAYQEAWQVGRISTSWQSCEDGKAPHFTVVIKCSKNPFDTL